MSNHDPSKGSLSQIGEEGRATQISIESPGRVKRRQSANGSCSRSHFRISAFWCALVMMWCAYLGAVSAQEHTEIIDHKLYQNIEQEERTYKFYKLTVGLRYLETGQENMIFKVIAEEFDSDPDIYISKTV